MISGNLKVLPGVSPLSFLLPRAPKHFEREVSVGGGELRWSQSGVTTSVHPSQIQEVEHDGGDSFVVRLKPTSGGVTALTMGADSAQVASDMVKAIQALVPDPAELSEALDSELSGERVVVELGDKKIEADLLVVACEPRNLINVTDYRPAELELFGRLKNFTFHTTILKVRVDPLRSQQLPYGVIFAPDPLDKLDGSFYGFRNETAKQFGQDAARAMSHNLVTTYQLRKEGDWPGDRFQEVLLKDIANCTWWPFAGVPEVVERFTTPYFDHFDYEALVDGAPWNLLSMQGKSRTLYVHASACFESVLHCWSYARFVLAQRPGVLPAKDAKIVILGAGPSGLLFASLLKREGYQDVELLESSDRYGGKTVTVALPEPHPPNMPEATVCELGTCYMSPAYDVMLEDLANYLEGNERFDFTQGLTDFRGIVAAGEFPDGYVDDRDGVVDFLDYVILKAAVQISPKYNNAALRALARADLVRDLVSYSLLHIEYMGLGDPMPSEPNQRLRETFAGMSLMDFLRKHSLESLEGVLQYSYQVQGYGVLQSIPAYYGLVWITPSVIWGILKAGLGQKDAGVTAWRRGWLDVWDQMVTKDGLQIRRGAQVTKITRPPTP